jgi:hypothetical protein
MITNFLKDQRKEILKQKRILLTKKTPMKTGREIHPNRCSNHNEEIQEKQKPRQYESSKSM